MNEPHTTPSPPVLELLQEVNQRKRANKSQSYKGRREEIYAYYIENNRNIQLANEKYAVSQQTLSDWNKKKQLGMQHLDHPKKGSTSNLPKELLAELLRRIIEIRATGQEVHLDTIVTNLYGLLLY